MAATGPWEDLPEDLLDQIFGLLPSFVELVCCSGVCVQWMITAITRDNARRLMLPRLLHPSSTQISYFCLFTTGELVIDSDAINVLPNARGARFLGIMPGDWFIIARGQWRGYARLNLVTREEDWLPDGLWGEWVEMDEVHDELEVGISPTAVLILAAAVSPVLTPNGEVIIAGIALGHHKAVCWTSWVDSWIPMEPLGEPQGEQDSEWWERVMLEEFEDVIYYHCDEQHGFFFLTTQERLLVFHKELDDGGGPPFASYGDFTFYTFEGQQMPLPPGAGQNVAGRYLVESEGRLFMVKRFTSPGRGTVSFQVFRLEWNNHQPFWQLEPALIGTLLFLRRGCSRALQTGRERPGYIYFLDDAEGFRDSWFIVRTEKQYPCMDAGWCSYPTQYVRKSWPQGPPPDSSPWIWWFDY